MTLAERYWGLTHVVLGAFLKDKKYRKYRGYSDDLLGVAALALTAASNNFDPERGVQFKTYASARMRGELKKEIQRIAKIEYHEVHINEYTHSETLHGEKDLERMEEEDYELVDSLEPEDEFEKAIYWRTILGDEGVKPLARDFNKSPNTIRKVRNNILSRLKEQLEKN